MRLRSPSGVKRGMRKQESPPSAWARTRNASHIGAEQNHLWPVSSYSAPGPPPFSGVATVVLARTSEPPCFSVIAIPQSAPALLGRRDEPPPSYSSERKRGSHSAATSGCGAAPGPPSRSSRSGSRRPASAWRQHEHRRRGRRGRPGCGSRHGEACRPSAIPTLHQLVPGGVELDLVDPVAEPVVGASSGGFSFASRAPARSPCAGRRTRRPAAPRPRPSRRPRGAAPRPAPGRSRRCCSPRAAGPGSTTSWVAWADARASTSAGSFRGDGARAEARSEAILAYSRVCGQPRCRRVRADERSPHRPDRAPRRRIPDPVGELAGLDASGERAATAADRRAGSRARSASTSPRSRGSRATRRGELAAERALSGDRLRRGRRSAQRPYRSGAATRGRRRAHLQRRRRSRLR